MKVADCFRLLVWLTWSLPLASAAAWGEGLRKGPVEPSPPDTQPAPGNTVFGPFISGQPPGGVRAKNSRRFNVYVSGPPGAPSLAYMLKLAVTLYLDVTIPEYSYKLRQWQEAAIGNSTAGDWYFKTKKDVIRQIEDRGHDPIVDSYLVSVDPNLYRKQAGLWWWKYSLRYDVFYARNNTPVSDFGLLNSVRRRAIDSLRADSHMVEKALDDVMNWGPPLLQVTVDRPHPTGNNTDSELCHSC